MTHVFPNCSQISKWRSSSSASSSQQFLDPVSVLNCFQVSHFLFAITPNILHRLQCWARYWLWQSFSVNGEQLTIKLTIGSESERKMATTSTWLFSFTEILKTNNKLLKINYIVHKKRKKKGSVIN